MNQKSYETQEAEYENLDEIPSPEAKPEVHLKSTDEVYENPDGEATCNDPPKSSNGVYESTNPQDTYLVPVRSGEQVDSSYTAVCT